MIDNRALTTFGITAGPEGFGGIRAFLGYSKTMLFMVDKYTSGKARLYLYIYGTSLERTLTLGDYSYDGSVETLAYPPESVFPFMEDTTRKNTILFVTRVWSTRTASSTYHSVLEYYNINEDSTSAPSPVTLYDQVEGAFLAHPFGILGGTRQVNFPPINKYIVIAGTRINQSTGFMFLISANETPLQIKNKIPINGDTMYNQQKSGIDFDWGPLDYPYDVNNLWYATHYSSKLVVYNLDINDAFDTITTDKQYKATIATTSATGLTIDSLDTTELKDCWRLG